MSGKSKVHEQLAHAFRESEFVRYIALLKGEEDMEKAASEAQRLVPMRSDSSIDARLTARRAVLDALKRAAAEAQKRITAICERGVRSGRVKSYTGCHIINAVVVESDRSTMEEIAELPEVEELQPDSRQRFI